MNIRRAAALIFVIAITALAIAWRIHTTSAATGPHAITPSPPPHVKAFPAAIDHRPTLPITGKTVELCGYGQIHVEPGGEIYPTWAEREL